MRVFLTAFLALTALGTGSTFTPVRADSTIQELRDTDGLPNDWNHWKYASQSWNLGTTYFCRVPNCVYRLEREGAQNLPHPVRLPHGTPGLVPGAAVAAEQSAAPASTAPQVGLFSVPHNVER